MSDIANTISQIKHEIGNVQLCVVSKYRSLDELQQVYDTGHRIFGENRVQELIEKQKKLPTDIKWHAIGHLQTNKVKYIAPFVSLIHSVDSFKLLKTIEMEAKKNDRVIPFLFQLHIASEESKYGLTAAELIVILGSEEYKNLTHVKCKGLMGMATFTDDKSQVSKEFQALGQIYSDNKSTNWDTLSMGMSGDYKTAIDCGSTLIRIGSKIFT